MPEATQRICGNLYWVVVVVVVFKYHNTDVQSLVQTKLNNALSESVYTGSFTKTKYY